MQKRRQFLKTSFGSLIGIGIFFSPIFKIVRRAFAKGQSIILPKDTPMETLIEKDPAVLDTRNLEPTSLNNFRTMGDTHHHVNMNSWRLEVTGRVGNPMKIAHPEILTLDSIERNVLLICPGVFAYHGRWKGISMMNLFEKTEMQDDVTHVTFSAPRNAGGNESTFPLVEVLSNKVFLAYGVNSVSLPQKHGFPLRLVAEGYYGSDWVKYVNHIRLSKT